MTDRTEPTIECPHCHKSIKLTESLAAPLIAESRAQLEREIQAKDAQILEKEQYIQGKEKEIAEKQKGMAEQISQQVEAQLEKDRLRIVAEEAEKAKRLHANELSKKSMELAEFQALLKDRDTKLEAAQKEQLEMLRKQRALDDEKRQLELTIEKRVQENIAQVRGQVQKEVQEEANLKLQEKDIALEGMRKKIEELKQRSEQGSQQLQGDAQEVELVNLLQAKFAHDEIERVGRGEFGGDVIQHVRSSDGQRCGTILWESKRTKHWSAEWLSKLREDQRAAKADVAIIVSQALPSEVNAFDLLDGIWVCGFTVAQPIAEMIRHSLLQLHAARQASKGQQTKTEMVYQYLTGTGFRQRIEAIVEAFSTMKGDLDKERKVITKQWAKRDAEIEKVISSTVGMYGDLQGIAGQSLQEIEGLGLDALDYDDTDDKADED